MPRCWWVYILTNRSGTLYIGVTGDLGQRLRQHREGLGSRFAHRYRMGRLVFVEEAPDPYAAISREKQLKSWTRARKIALINGANPGWEDLGRYVLPDSDP
ncbi:MAG TPA: GIY-YIG nuclease family protein [Gemmatimonadaceae bacterium]